MLRRGVGGTIAQRRRNAAIRDLADENTAEARKSLEKAGRLFTHEGMVESVLADGCRAFGRRRFKAVTLAKHGKSLSMDDDKADAGGAPGRVAMTGSAT